MLEKLRNKRKDKKGFTLVELIVVLIILAILAALLIPALTGYIDKAKDKQIIAETRQAVMAAQTLADEEYAKGVEVKKETFTTDLLEKVKKLGEVQGDITVDTVTSGKIMKLTYKNADRQCVYEVNDTTGTTTYTPSTITPST